MLCDSTKKNGEDWARQGAQQDKQRCSTEHGGRRKKGERARCNCATWVQLCSGFACTLRASGKREVGRGGTREKQEQRLDE